MSAAAGKIVDPRLRATEYLAEHKVMELFELLGAKVAIFKPENPSLYVLEELKKIQETRVKGGVVTLFSESDLEVLFGVFDLTGRGYITREQFLRAFDAVGIQATKGAANVELPVQANFDKETFVRIMLAEVNKRTL